LLATEGFEECRLPLIRWVSRLFINVKHFSILNTSSTSTFFSFSISKKPYRTIRIIFSIKTETTCSTAARWRAPLVTIVEPLQMIVHHRTSKFATVDIVSSICNTDISYPYIYDMAISYPNVYNTVISFPFSYNTDVFYPFI